MPQQVFGTVSQVFFFCTYIVVELRQASFLENPFSPEFQKWRFQILRRKKKQGQLQPHIHSKARVLRYFSPPTIDSVITPLFGLCSSCPEENLPQVHYLPLVKEQLETINLTSLYTGI